MAHLPQQKFCWVVRALFSAHFQKKKVLDIGSLDINGNNRFLFSDCDYTGIDIGPGPNVDVVCKAHEFEAPEGSFDTIVSTECFEHDRYYRETLQHAVRLLKPGGMFLFTCASTGRAEHGTVNAHPGSSPFTATSSGWESYYKNLTEQDVREAIDVDRIFSIRCQWNCDVNHTHTLVIPQYQFLYCEGSKDLYFWGIKSNCDMINAGDVLSYG